MKKYRGAIFRHSINNVCRALFYLSDKIKMYELRFYEHGAS